MSWFKLDDKFHSHSKVVAAGNAAVGLFVRCGAWTADQQRDGFIPEAIAALYGTKREIAALVDVRLWAKVDGGYYMPDYLEYNFSAEEVEERRGKRAEAGRMGGLARARAAKSQANGQASASGVLQAPSKQSATPSRPVPSLLLTSSSDTQVGSPVDNSDDDDDETQARRLTALALAKAHHASNEPAYTRTALANLEHDGHAQRIRQRLALGDQPIAIAAAICGSTTYANLAARELT
jgi:hypothetical protein